LELAPLKMFNQYQPYIIFVSDEKKWQQATE